jgi:hypothetical protein
MVRNIMKINNNVVMLRANIVDPFRYTIPNREVYNVDMLKANIPSPKQKHHLLVLRK